MILIQFLLISYVVVILLYLLYTKTEQTIAKWKEVDEQAAVMPQMYDDRVEFANIPFPRWVADYTEHMRYKIMYNYEVIKILLPMYPSKIRDKLTR